MWVVILIVWFGSIILTYLNTTMVRKIKKQQQNAEAIQMDGRYVKNNFQKINTVFAERALLEQSIESAKLGLIAIENKLKKRSNQYQLTKVTFSTAGGETESGNLPILMTCEGSSAGIFNLLDFIEKNYPFLPVTALNMSKSPEGSLFRFQIMMNYRYKLTT